MDLATLLAKDITTLTDEEKGFIKEHKAELTAEQLTSHTAIVDEPAEDAGAEETAEAKAAREATEAADKVAADEAAAKVAADAAAAADGIQASEKVMISASELAILRTKADQGQQAFKELEAKKLGEAVAALSFSDTNKTGKFLPKSTDKLRTFMQGLSAEQKLAFSTLIADLPKTQVFNEIGGAGAADGTAKAEVDAKVAVLEKTGMKYSDALKQVMSENEGLETRYDSELPSARKVQA